MKKIKRIIRTKGATRLVALALCFVTLATIIPVALLASTGTLASPQEKPPVAVANDTGQPTDMPMIFYQAARGLQVETAPKDSKEPMVFSIATNPIAIWFQKAWHSFWSSFSVLSYVWRPAENLVFNQKDAFQKIFGYNNVYDMFMWLANVYADTLRCKFTYEGKEWLVQLWKGSYAVFLCTGGEIGVYNRPESKDGIHYAAAKQPDWLGIEMSIYNRGERLFTRPFDTQWWCTGYYFGYLHGFWRRPRTDCVMEARIQLKSPAMAKLFAGQLAAKGFTKAKQLKGVASPESYTISGDTVRFVWQNVTEAYF